MSEIKSEYRVDNDGQRYVITEARSVDSSGNQLTDSAGNPAVNTINHEYPIGGTLVVPQILAADAPEARITWGDHATPFSHCRVYVNGSVIADAATALEANIETEIITEGTTIVYTGSKINSVAIVGVYRLAASDNTDPAPITPTATAGTLTYGTIPDTLDYGGGGTEVEDRTIFWDFTANSATGVDMAKIVIPPTIFSVGGTAADTPPTCIVRCTGYNFG